MGVYRSCTSCKALKCIKCQGNGIAFWSKYCHDYLDIYMRDDEGENNRNKETIYVADDSRHDRDWVFDSDDGYDEYNMMFDKDDGTVKLVLD